MGEDSRRARSSQGREFEPMRAMTTALSGNWCDDGKSPPYGERLRCPMCGENAVTIRMGDRAPVAFCGARVRGSSYRTGCKASGVPLLKAMTAKTSIWLTLRKRPKEPPEKAVERMRETREYRDLSPKAKLVVDHLVSSVIAKMGANGRMLRSKKDWMLVIDPRSSNQTDKAIAGALASGLVFRELSVSTPKGGRPSFLYGLKCLPTDTDRTSRAKPRAKPPKRGLNHPEKPGNAGGGAMHRTYGASNPQSRGPGEPEGRGGGDARREVDHPQPAEA